ncbi:MAG: phosphoribosyltransferase family protein [Ktedonobacterales bacterium]
MSEARVALLDHFRWVDGHADVWHIFRDAATFRAVICALVNPFRSAGISAVAGIESRGFLLGGAAAVELGVGFIAVRKAGVLFPGEKARALTGLDYRGIQTELAMQRAAVKAGDRVLLVDDWVETGSQACAVATLIAACGGQLVGISVMVDQLSDSARTTLPPVQSLVSSADLPLE